MTTETYRRNYLSIEWLPMPKHEPQPVRKARSHLAGPMLIRDEMEPVQSMLDGRMYDSKSKLRATYREAGVTEVGNENPKPTPQRGPDRKQVRASVGKALSRAGFGA